MIEIDFVTHSEVFIAAPRSAVWPFILDPSRWRSEPKAVHAGGRVGEIGERFDVTAPGDDVVSFRLENVELVSGRRRTIRLEAPDGRFWGFASWVLAESGTGTSVTYDVYCHYPVPAETDYAALLAEGQRRALEDLKPAVEAEYSGAGRARR
jgi:hypothetical protein